MRLATIALLAGLIVSGSLLAGPALAAVDCSDDGAVGRVALLTGRGAPKPGSFGNPWINRHHVYCGDINRRGKAVGFHYRQGGKDPRTGPGNNNPSAARITGVIKHRGGAQGWRIYRGEGIEIWDDVRERYRRKNGFSTFFPDNCSPEELTASIRHAVRNASKPLPAKGGRFRGKSGPADGAAGYCYRLERKGGAKTPFAVSGFLNNLRNGGWTINSAYPE